MLITNFMFIQREIYTQIKPFLDGPEAIVITGIRRAGKTFFLKHLFDEIKSANKVFLDLENPAEQLLLEKTDYNMIPANLGLDTSQKAFIFIDEIQELKSTPSVVKYLSDHFNIKFFLTGSSSFYIRNMFTESLAGRKFIFELFPFSFNEFLWAKNEALPILSSDQKISEYQLLHYGDLFDEYIRFGGFPKVVLAKTVAEKEAQLKEFFSAYWSLEVEKLSDFRKKNKLRDLIFLLLERVGNKMDIQKLSNELGITRNTVMEYIAFLQDTYLLSAISPYSTSRDVEIRGAKKVYFVDSGFLNQFAKIDRGSIFENTIFNLLRHRGEVQYWQQKDGQEIDFVVDKKTAYEVKLAADEQNLKTLSRRCEKIGIKDYYVVSYKKFDHPKTVYGFML